MKRGKVSKNLTEGALIPQILLFTLPLIVTAILQLLFNTADMIVVGRWGGDTPEACANSLAAVGSCGSLITMLVNLFFGISAGAGVCVAYDIGAGKEEDVKKTVHTSVLTALLSGAFVTVVGILVSRPALALMGTDASILDEATLYITAYFCGMPANMLYNFCASILRAKGDSSRPLVFLTVAGVANVLLNLLTVIVFRWGALGVGIATAASQWVSCILVVIYMLRMEGPCRIEPRLLHFDLSKLRRILYNGIPAGVQSLLFSISNIMVQASVNSFGPVVVAGNTAAGNLDAYIYTTQNSLFLATQTFVAQHNGAQKFQRMKKVVLCCSGLVVVVGLLVGGFIYLLRDPFLRIYAPDNQSVVDAGAIRLTVMCATYFLCGLMEVGSGVLKGLGRAISSTLITLLGGCGLRIVWILTVFAYVKAAADPTTALFTLYLSYPVTWLMTAPVLFGFGALLIHREIKKEKEKAKLLL